MFVYVWVSAGSAKLPGSEKRDGDSENHDDENIPTGDEGGDGGRVGDDDDEFEAGDGEVGRVVRRTTYYPSTTTATSTAAAAFITISQI